MTHVNAATVDTLKREFEKIVAEKNPIMLANRTHDKSKQWSDCYYCHPNSAQASTLVKRIQAVAKVDNNLAGLLMPIAHRLMLKQAEIAVAKDAALKNRNDKKAAQMAKKQDAEETKKNPYRTLHPEVAALLKQVAEPYRVKAVEFETKRLNRILSDIKNLAVMFGSYDPSVIYPTKKGDTWGNNVQAINQANARMFIEQDRTDYFNPKYTVLDDAESAKLIKAKAERFAEDMVTAFIYKVGTKLSGIVEKKGNLGKANISGSLQDHWMSFEFRDGSAFQVQSQIVWKTSVNGVHFAQYPTCFRNVKLSNGTRMELPSEAKMKEAFV